MIEEKKQALIILFFSVMGLLTGLLFFEYRSVCYQAERLATIQEQYQKYIEIASNIIEKYSRESKSAWGDQWLLQPYSSLFSSDNPDAINIFVNRGERYLKDSMIAHLKANGFESLLNRINTEDCIGYPSSISSQELLAKSASSKKIVKVKAKPTELHKKNIRSVAGLTLSWPIERNRFWLSSLFGPRKNPDNSWGFHRGIDMAALKGTAVRSAASGIVLEARYVSGYGNMIVVQHNRKYKTRYAHLDTIGVKAGQRIMRGNLLGTVGDTGLVRKQGKDASHLHFEVCVLGKQANPLQFFA